MNKIEGFNWEILLKLKYYLLVGGRVYTIFLINDIICFKF